MRKLGLRGFQPRPTQTGLLKHRFQRTNTLIFNNFMHFFLCDLKREFSKYARITIIYVYFIALTFAGSLVRD